MIASLSSLSACGGGSGGSATSQVGGNDDSTSLTTVPSATVTRKSVTQIVLQWQAPSAGAVTYRILRDGAATPIAEVIATTYTDTDVQPATQYVYVIQAVDAGGHPTAASDPITVTTPSALDVTAPSIPGDVRATAVNAGLVQLGWDASTDPDAGDGAAVSGVASYQVVRRIGSAGDTRLSAAADISFTDTDVQPQTTYHYQVRAIDAAGNVSGLSADVVVTTPALPDTSAPSVPTGLTAKATSTTTVDLDWSASSDDAGVAKYRIYRNGSSTVLAETTQTNYTDAQTAPGTAYSYQVRAVDTSGNVSPLSAAASATTPFVHPGILVGDAQLSLVKAHLAANEQPWLAAFQKAKASSLGSLSYTPHAVAMVECTGSTSDSCYFQLQDAQAAYTDALLYRLTGTQAYGDKAVEIMDAWSATMQGFHFENGLKGVYANTALWAAWIAEVFPRAAELMRYSSYGWPDAKARKFGDMMQYHLSFVGNDVGSSIGSFDWAGNWALSFADATMAIAVYTDNPTLFAKGVDKWRGSMTSSVYLASDPAGHPVSPAGTYKGSSLTNLDTLKADWHGPTAYIEGIEQETCRDLGHVAMAFGASLNAAETGYLQGLDLYGEQTDRFVKGIEYNLRFYNNTHFLTEAEALAAGMTAQQIKDGLIEKTPGTWIAGTDVSGWACPTNPLRGGGAVKLPFDIAYNHFVGRLGLAMPQTKKLLSTSRPADSSDHMNWATLTHGLP